MNRRSCLSFAILVVAALPAQADRYEIGLRLRSFERHLEACPQTDLRQASLRHLETAVQAFFRLDMQGVARALDAADQALDRTDPTAEDPARRWARGLMLRPEARLHDPATGALPFRIEEVWPELGVVPPGAQLVVSLGPDKPPLAQFPLGRIPLAESLELREVPEGDYPLTWSIRIGDRDVATRTQGISLVLDLNSRLAHLEAADDERDGEKPRSIESLTLASHVATLRSMRRARREETVLPGARLLAEAQELAAAIADGHPFYGPARPGEHWLRIPTGSRTTALRMYSPATGDQKRPLVVALHGAGGSENLFFDAYGDGAILRLCRERAYYLVAPRSEALASLDLPALIDALADRWPIDTRKVAVVGHSMGAGQAVAHATRNPDRFAAIAALGGGGRVPRAANVRRLPFYVGVGERDFARAGAQSLQRALAKAGAPLTFREFPDVEHLAIVQFALPEVFAFFAKALDAN